MDSSTTVSGEDMLGQSSVGEPNEYELSYSLQCRIKEERDMKSKRDMLEPIKEVCERTKLGSGILEELTRRRLEAWW